MRALFQISLGLLPAILILALGLAFRRISRLRAVLLLIPFAAAALGCAGYGGFEAVSSGRASAAADPELVLELIRGTAEQGEAQLARTMLEKLEPSDTDQAQAALCLARVCALEGDAPAAGVLYRKAQMLDKSIQVEEELEAARRAAADPQAGEELAALAQSALEEAPGRDEMGQAVKTLVQTEACYAEYLSSGTLDEDQVRKLGKRLDQLEETLPQVFTLDAMRIARLKLNVLAQDFRSIAAQTGENSNYDELLVISELYLNGYVKESYFEDSYGEEYARQCEAVADQVEQLYDKQYSSQSKTARAAVKSFLKSLEYAQDHPALVQLKSGLYDYTQQDNADDRSKVYLQLAKIETQTGSTAGAEQYLSASLNNAADCRDENFTQPMYEIIGIIADKDDPERLKDVAGYVDRIVSNSAVVRMPAQLTENRQEQAETVSFQSYMTDYVSQKRAAVNITQVDTGDFPRITASLSITTPVPYTDEELAARLEVQDCGGDIDQFSLKKINYSRVNVLLCCDVSGSMGGQPIKDLREAVKLFAGNLEDNQQMALVTFSSAVQDVYPFGTDQSALLAAADALRSGGGTDMYSAALYAMDQFKPTQGERNVIILLSDGADNSKKSEDKIRQELGEAARRNQVTLYSLGLGSSVDTGYLSDLSTVCGGTFLYVDNSQTLNSFYEYLNGLMFSQYELTYTAVDTLRTSRSLKVSLRDDSNCRDIAYYTLGDDTDSQQTGENAVSPMAGVEITGLDTRLLFRSLSSQQVRLLGSGLAEEKALSVTIKGQVDYELQAEFESENAWVLTIPAGVACGTYDLYVEVDGQRAVLDRELVIAVQGGEKKVAFGPYVFTAYSVVREEKEIHLSGYVTLNGWLKFKGDVTLQGDLEKDASIRMTTSDGAYVQYYEGSSQGLAALFAENNWKAEVPALGTRTLYNDAVHDPGGDDYRVDTTVMPAVYMNQVLTFATPGLKLYADRLVLDSDAFTTAFPLQNKLMKKAGLDAFSFDLAIEAQYSATRIDCSVEFENKRDSKIYYPVNLGSMPIYFNPAEVKVKIDTAESDYSIDFKVRLAFLGETDDGLGLKLAWSESLVPTEVGVYINMDLNTNISGVPVTFSDFYFGLKDIDVKQPVANWTLTGQATASAVKIDSLLKGIGKYFGDISVCSLKDATVEFSLGQAHLLMKTDFYLLEQIKLAGLEIEAGKFSYSCYLLNMDSESVAGMRAKFTKGIIWETDNCDIDISGSNELVLTNRMLGVVSTGTYKVEVQWWILQKEVRADGAAVLGVYQAHNGDTVFILKGAANSEKKNKSVMISWSKNSGFDTEIKL